MSGSDKTENCTILTIISCNNQAVTEEAEFRLLLKIKCADRLDGLQGSFSDN